jgi:Flp pilus assembly protein CpaB
VPVVVTTENLLARDRFGPDNLRAVQMPEDLVTPNAATTIDEIAGHRTGFLIYQNQQVALADVMFTVGS